jgi:small GTP-binding protein
MNKTIVLAGNPNVGKSVIFNKLTGRYAVVSNYPGTTVDLSRGVLVAAGENYQVLDTPGTNSLIPVSEDEQVTRDVLFREKPDIIVQVGDAKNLSRTLLLTLELMELGIPMVLALNMYDEARERGMRLDRQLLEKLLGIPVVGGNVSLYNETDGKGIFPTPTCAVVGLVPHVGCTVGSAFRKAGDAIALLGVNTGEAGGSEYLAAIHGKTAGLPPRLDLDREAKVQAAARKLAREGLVSSAHDCSDGGLAVALAECCVMGEGPHLGARVKVAGDARADLLLFAEDPSRVVNSVDPAHRAAVERIARDAGAPLSWLGEVGGDTLAIGGMLEVKVADLSREWREGLPRVLEG